MTWELHQLRDERFGKRHWAASILLARAGIVPLDLPFVEHDSSDGLMGLSYEGRCLMNTKELDRVYETLSLERELKTGLRDGFGRFDDTHLAWPKETPWIDSLALERLGSNVDRAEDRGFRVVLTHDIDWSTSLEPFSLAKALLKTVAKRPVRWLSLDHALNGRTMRKSLERLLDLETRLGVRSLFFMLADRHGLGRHGSRYDLRWSSARRMGNAILDAGMLLGLHGSYAARERGLYRKQAERMADVFGRTVRYHRNHYLRFDSSRLASQMEDAGIRYDFSVGFARHAGFRAGTAGEYPLYNVLENRVSPVKEIPLVYMDSTFADEPTWSLEPLETLLRQVKQVGGTVSVLFHPELFAVDERLFEHYERCIALCRDLGADLDLSFLENNP